MAEGMSIGEGFEARVSGRGNVAEFDGGLCGGGGGGPYHFGIEGASRSFGTIGEHLCVVYQDTKKNKCECVCVCVHVHQKHCKRKSTSH